MTKTNTLTVTILKELVHAGVVSNIRLEAQGDGFAVYIRCGISEKALQAKRGHIRHFRSLDRAVAFLRNLGLTRMEIDVSRWETHQRSLELI